MSTRDVTVPDIGDFKDVPVIAVMVKPGDVVKAEDLLITLESEKAVLEIPSPFGGTVAEILTSTESKVSQGDPIVRLYTTAPAHSAPMLDVLPLSDSNPVPLTAPAAPKTLVASEPAQPKTAAINVLAHAGPSVRALARELGVTIDQVPGSGPKGRILREDVFSLAKGPVQGEAPPIDKAPISLSGLSLLPWPQVDFAKFGEVERSPLSRLRKISGSNLARNWVMIPHVTNFDEADVTELEVFRKNTNSENVKSGIKVTMLAFMIRAAAAVLKVYPEFNASLDGEDLIMKRYFHIGFAVDTPNGLIEGWLRLLGQKFFRDKWICLSG
jgi:pyruvate dehydrogenase E2 component (dihydrolipoamide acetyltransferase)